MAYQYQPIAISFTAGLDTKSNPQASKPPSMDVLQNIEFDLINGYQKRKPFNAMPNAIQGGGTLANCRGEPFSYRGELCVFTSDSLYSWSPTLAVWIKKGTHLAVHVTENPAFQTAGDQIDADRAELGGVIAYAWAEGGGFFTGVIDKATGAVLLPPASAAFMVAGPSPRPRLIALATRIAFIWFSPSGGYLVNMLDPANVAAGFVNVATVSVGSGLDGARYDATRVIGADALAIVGTTTATTSYTIATVTAAGVKVQVSKARTCDGTIALSCSPDGLHLQIVRCNVLAVQGDLLLIPTLADVFTNQAIGAVSNSDQIACAHQSVLTGGFYRCYVLWTSGTLDVDGNATLINRSWVDTNGALGGALFTLKGVGLASRAFDYNGSIYFWGAFAGISSFPGANAAGFRAQLQNGYFLYRNDDLGPFLCAQAVYDAAGGLAPSAGHLPGVALTAGTTTFSWVGADRRVISLGVNQSGYAERAPRDVVFTFDSNEARRTGQFGQTQIIAAGEVLQYDGAAIVELGYHTYPWWFSLAQAGAGHLADATYSYKSSFACSNAQGELDRSTTATVAILAVAAGGGTAAATIAASKQLTVTHRNNSNPPRVEFWRTQGNAQPQASFYLATSQDPSVTANPNRFLPNDVTANTPTFVDALADASLTVLQENPENGGALEHLAPPGASIVLVTKDRVFLAGIPGSPDSIWYSRLKTDGEVASFNDFLQIQVGPGNGDITGMEFINETLIVFRRYACYAYAGTGFDNTGGGNNFNGTKISDDIGAVSSEGIAKIENAILFKSSKGWFVVGQNLQLTYVGKEVAKFDGDAPLSCVVMETQHQVRCLTNGRMLVWDTLVNNWAEWTIADGLGSCVWQGRHVYLTATGPKIQALDFTGVNYGFAVEMAFLAAADLQGSTLVRSYMVLGEYRGDHKLQMDTCRDYLQDGAGNWVYLADPINVYTPSPTLVGSAYQVKHGPSVLRYQAIKVRLTELLGVGGVWTEGARLTGITFDAANDGKAWPNLPASQKA